MSRYMVGTTHRGKLVVVVPSRSYKDTSTSLDSYGDIDYTALSPSQKTGRYGGTHILGYVDNHPPPYPTSSPWSSPSSIDTTNWMSQLSDSDTAPSRTTLQSSTNRPSR